MSENNQEQAIEQEKTTPINPDIWTTGTEPISAKQATELQSLSK